MEKIVVFSDQEQKKAKWVELVERMNPLKWERLGKKAISLGAGLGSLAAAGYTAVGFSAPHLIDSSLGYSDLINDPNLALTHCATVLVSAAIAFGLGGLSMTEAVESTNISQRIAALRREIIVAKTDFTAQVTADQRRTLQTGELYIDTSGTNDNTNEGPREPDSDLPPPPIETNQVT